MHDMVFYISLTKLVQKVAALIFSNLYKSVKLPSYLDVGYKHSELASALQRYIVDIREDPISLSEREINRKIHENLKGGCIMYDQPMIQQSEYRLRTIVVRWIKKD